MIKEKKPREPGIFDVIKLFKVFKWRIIALLFLGAIGIIAFSFTPMLTRSIFNSLETSMDYGSAFNIFVPQLTSIYWYLAMFLLIVLFNEAFQFFAIVLIIKYETQIKESLTNEFKRKLDIVPISFLENFSTGDLARRVSNLPAGMIRHVLSIIFRIARTTFFFLTTAIVMFTINWILALVVIASLPLCIITARIVSKRTQKLFNNNNATILETSAYVDQKFSMHEFYKTHGIEGASEEYEAFNKKEAKTMAGEDVAVAFNTIYINFIQNFMLILVTVVFGILFVTRVLPEFGALPAFLVFSNRFLANAIIVTETTNVFQAVNARTKKAFEILNYPERHVETEIHNLENVDEIEFKKVTLEKNGEELLKNLNFKIPKGTSVAIVGTVGGGKGKIVDVLSKLEPPTHGNVLINGISLDEFKREDYYSRIGIAFERPFIFKGTIAENLLYGIRRTLPEYVMTVTKQLGIHDFIEQLPNRYETEVSENSPLLSDSQRQAINIARTILKASDLVIFNEAYSRTDTITEKETYEHIIGSNPNQTKVFVTHRLASIEKCDLILFFHKGRVVEQGTHKELMSLKKYYYRAYMNN
ncbi:MAG: ABC transporter ATP-binding protein/permease [Firmicutes bacterium]|nr:ABC transporter ATP-binding protein/permease [Bacillota bacterium]